MQTLAFRTSPTQRALTLGVVAALHILVLVVLTANGFIPPLLPVLVPARFILQRPPPPPPPPRIQPTTPLQFPAFVPTTEITLATPPPVRQPAAALRAITRTAPDARQANHFGAATSSGLGLDVAATSGGGSGVRGTLAGFEAAVRARVLAAKHQPILAWDRRNTCIVNYRVSVSVSGALAGFSIDPCAVPEINQAARDAISRSGPFPPPPSLGAPTVEVHGSMIFHP